MRKVILTLLAMSAALFITAVTSVAHAGPDTGIPKPRPPDQCRPNSNPDSPCCRRNPDSPGCWEFTRPLWPVVRP